jgi:energy-coupling factor transporter transmembrane protein EcfT
MQNTTCQRQATLHHNRNKFRCNIIHRPGLNGRITFIIIIIIIIIVDVVTSTFFFTIIIIIIYRLYARYLKLHTRKKPCFWGTYLLSQLFCGYNLWCM